MKNLLKLIEASGLSVGGAMAMYLFGYSGYSSGGVDRTDNAAKGILWVFSVAPALVFLLTALIVGFFKLNSKLIAQNAREIDLLRKWEYQKNEKPNDSLK